MRLVGKRPKALRQKIRSGSHHAVHPLSPVLDRKRKCGDPFFFTAIADFEHVERHACGAGTSYSASFKAFETQKVLGRHIDRPFCGAFTGG
jgi:hypothetical protein